MTPRLRWTLALRDSRYDQVAKHVALTLATHMDKDGGSCFPGRDLLAKETSLDVRTIDRAIQRLETAGWLRIARSKGGARRPNHYFATFPNRGTESPLNGGRAPGLNSDSDDDATAAQVPATATLTTSNPGAGAPLARHDELVSNSSSVTRQTADAKKTTHLSPSKKTRPDISESWFNENLDDLHNALRDMP